MEEALDLNNPRFSYGSIDDRDILFLIKAVRKGIEFNKFLALTEKSPFTLNEWSGFLHISERTMQRYKREKKAFDPIHTEKILEVTLLYKHGVEVFGNKEKFNEWLDTINLAIGGIKPKELLDNTFGISLLKDELTRIEYGVLA
ncbi:type II RES/Xre toxin-antitoxin system antitoxin [Abyssalbus ytuae]|uniref:DUF2384 domain-containing protein n=1 Tax=Abyssalbus ytuae TaxID=2926907 RepID=A0A9E7A0M5_9FLAO|nr:antitoxin Xre/MbcA/ParS toxin-binding domain-containing protein [Abyssalbus ytuae]UOB17526.1 DUF2384 domain-containing protein [Abyssalbus ytuae]